MAYIFTGRKNTFRFYSSYILHTSDFSEIKTKAEAASRKLAEEYGEPLWCKGTGMRNTHVMAIAPTVSNSTIAGGVSAGIEPIPANVYTFNSAKGTLYGKTQH